MLTGVRRHYGLRIRLNHIQKRVNPTPYKCLIVLGRMVDELFFSGTESANYLSDVTIQLVSTLMRDKPFDSIYGIVASLQNASKVSDQVSTHPSLSNLLTYEIIHQS